MADSDVMQWYVLNSEGRTVSTVIVAGPFTTYAEAQKIWSDPELRDNLELEIALLNSNKVTHHMAQDTALYDWLKNRQMFNPFS